MDKGDDLNSLLKAKKDKELGLMRKCSIVNELPTKNNSSNVKKISMIKQSINNQKSKKDFVGTPDYMAPEVINYVEKISMKKVVQKKKDYEKVVQKNKDYGKDHVVTNGIFFVYKNCSC